ncbi:MAG: YafY family protein [Thiolinea sp.]
MRKAQKLFQLTNLLRVRQPVTANQIAEELNVSVRTVYRYIDDLSVSGIPIYGIAGVGYRLDEAFELPPLSLTDSELDALMLGIRMVSTWTGDTLSESAKSLANKINAVLPENMKNQNSAFIDAPDLSMRVPERRKWELLYHLIKQYRIATIHYETPDGSQTTRDIYPLGLLYWGGKWTTACWCTLREDFRSFRVDRIRQIEAHDAVFQETDKVSFQQYLATVKNFKCD